MRVNMPKRPINEIKKTTEAYSCTKIKTEMAKAAKRLEKRVKEIERKERKERNRKPRRR